MGWAQFVKAGLEAGNENMKGAMKAADAHYTSRINAINYKTQAGLADIQSGLVDLQEGHAMNRAGSAQVAGELDADRRARQGSLHVGSARATAAGRGILVDSGTAQSVADNIRSGAQEDIDIINQNTWMNVWGQTQQAAQAKATSRLLKGQSELARYNAKSQKELGRLGVIYELSNGFHQGGMAFAGSLSNGL